MPTPPLMLTHAGVTRSIRDWSGERGVPVETIRCRLKRGWGVRDALFTPADRRFQGGGRHPSSAPRPCPRLKRHRATRQAFVEWTVNGERNTRYFGVWGSEESKKAYARFQVEWATRTLSGGPLRPGKTLAVAALAKAWIQHCEAWYVKEGKPTSEVNLQFCACNYLVQLFGATPVDEFGPDDLRAVRALMVDRKLSRRTVNAYQTRIKQMFGWGVGKQLVAPGIWHALQPVERLARKKTSAKDRPRKRAVAWADVEAVLPHLHPNPARRAVLEALVRAHWFVGGRPQDMVGMRPADLERSGPEWEYVPDRHKNEHRDEQLTYLIGPRAQAVLTPFLADCPAGRPVFVYLPRHTGHGCGREIAITRHEYGRRVAAACKAAGVKPWTPHQLRHSKATEVMRIYESDAAAAAAIGDSPEVTRTVYIDPLDAVRRRIARETG